MKTFLGQCRAVCDQIVNSGILNSLASRNLLALGAHFMSAGLASGSQFILARLMGAQSYGDYAYVLAWMSVLAYFAALGFDVALLRFIPAYEAKEKWGLAEGVIKYAQRRVLFTGLAVALLGVTYAYLWRESIGLDLANTFLIGFMLVPVWSLLWIRCSIARSSGGVLMALIPDRLTRESVLIAIVLVAALLLNQNVDALLAMSATLIGSVIGLVMAVINVRILREGNKNWSPPPEYDVEYWRRSILPLVVLGAVEVFINRTGVISLGYMGQPVEAGVFGLVFNIAFVVTLPRTAVNTLFAPNISALYAAGESENLRALIAKSTVWMLGFSALIAFPLFLFAEQLLAWFGPAFVPGAVALKTLVVVQLAAVAAGSQINILTMTGNESIAAMLLTGFAILNIALNVVLIHFAGLTGAAAANALCLLFWNVAMAFYIHRRLGLMPGVMEIAIRNPGN